MILHIIWNVFHVNVPILHSIHQHDTIDTFDFWLVSLLYYVASHISAIMTFDWLVDWISMIIFGVIDVHNDVWLVGRLNLYDYLWCDIIMYMYHTKGNHRDSIDQPIKHHYVHLSHQSNHRDSITNQSNIIMYISHQR